MILVVFQNMDFLMHIPFMDTCQYAYIGSQHSPVSRWSPFFCHFLRIISMFHDRNFQRNWDSCVPTAGGGLTEAIFIAASEFLAIFEKWSRLSTALCAWRQQLLLLLVSGLQCALPTDGFFAIPTPERFCPQSLVAPSSAAPPATLPPPSGGLSAPSHSPSMQHAPPPSSARCEGGSSCEEEQHGGRLSLSLFELCPSWESIMASSSAQTNLRPCLLLPGLLSLLASAFPKNRSRHVGLRGAYLDHVASVPCTSNSLLPMANTLNHRLQSAISSIAQCAPAVSMYTSAAGGPPNLAAPIPSSLAGSMTEVANTTGEARAFHHCHDTDARAMGFRSHRVGEYAPSKGHRDAISRVPNTHSDLPELGKPIAFCCHAPSRSFPVCSLHISLHCYRAAPYFLARYEWSRLSCPPWLCPVDAALSLLRRAFALKPFIIAMLHTLGARVSTGIAVDAQHILDLHALLFDAISLGIFTGSQVGEYAKSKEAQNVLSRVPASHSNPVERGKPNTFVAGDFVVYDKLRRAVSPQTAYLSPLAVTELHLTFQHDKSDRCFTLRKFGRNHNQSLPGLYPVYAALSLLRCATALGIPPNDPICAFWLIKGGSHPHFLCNSDVTCYERSLSG
jgi:hypothetical protein